MMRFFTVSVVFAQVLLAFSGQAQVNNQRYAADNYRPITPGAYSFFKYIDNPTDLYHGIPSISVPVYTLKVGAKSFPLAFTYHAGGIRVTEEASWVGLGWDFSLPTIVQTINDEDDLNAQYEAPNTAKRIRPDWPGSYMTNGSINYPLRFLYGSNSNGDGPYWTPTYPPSSGLQPLQTQHHYRISCDYYLPFNTNFNIRQSTMFESQVDSEPDVFKVSLFGVDLSFIRDFNTGDIKLLNNSTYKIEKITNDMFKIIDGEGYKYLFGNKQINTTTTTDENSYGTSSSVNSPSIAIWNLTTIISPQGQQATFNYNAPYGTHATVDFKQKYQRIVQRSVNYTNGALMSAYSVPPTGSVSQDSIRNTRSITHEVKQYINSISSDNRIIRFYGSSRTDLVAAQQLDSIHIIDISIVEQRLLKKLILTHDYFNADASASTTHVFNSLDENRQQTLPDNTRLRLSTLTESGTGTYHFAYDPQPLPPRNSFAQDFWGYYNGAYFNTSLVPNPKRLKMLPSNIADNGTNSGARLQYARAGILTQMIFPTGGSKSFSYELNTFTNSWAPDYDSLNNKITKGNGLRIKRIISTGGGSNPPLVTEYTYQGGQTMLETKYYRAIFYPTIYHNSYNVGGSDLMRADNTLHEIKANAQYSPALLGSGTGVGYTSVKEQQVSGYTTPSPDNAGITTHYFANIADANVNTDNVNTPYQYESSQLYGSANITLPTYKIHSTTQNGLEDSVKYFDTAGHLLKKIINRYQTATSSLDYGARIFSNGLYWVSTGPAPYGSDGNTVTTYALNLIGFYPLFEKTSSKISETTIQYSASGQYFTQKVTYLLDTYNRIVSKRDENLARATSSTTTSFEPSAIYDYVYPDSRLQTGDADLLTANRLDAPVVVHEAHALRATSTATASPTAFASYTYEKFYGLNHNPFANGSVLDSVRETMTYPANPTTHRRLTRYRQYNAQGDYQLAYRNQELPTAYLWYTDYSKLLAEVKNALPNAVAYTSFEPFSEDNRVGSGTQKWSWVAKSASGGVTGEYCAQLVSPSPGVPFELSTPSSLPIGRYVMSYWAKGGVPQLSSAGGTATFAVPQVVLARADGWTQYQTTINLPTTNVRIQFAQNTSIFVDEMRLYPLGSQMTSYTYGPWRNLTSQTDMAGHITTYEYDAVGRLLRTRDEQGRILSQQQYHYARP